MGPTSPATGAPPQTGGAPAPSGEGFRPGRLIVAILLSLFVCPGLGHRHLGRPRAAWIVITLFLAAFIVMSWSLYHAVQDTVKELGKGGRGRLLQAEQIVRQTLEKAEGFSVGLFFLLIIYLGAPVELLIMEGLRLLGPTTPPSAMGPPPPP